MKAIVQRRYGSPDKVLEFDELAPPRPRAREVLLRVHASSVNPGDRFVVLGRPYVFRLAFGLSRPRRQVPGMDVAGTVEAVGAQVTRLRPGDEVYGELPGGAYAEYAVAQEDRLAIRPTNVDAAHAAAVPVAGMTALQGLRDAGALRSGHRVLINGASGGVGTFAVQIAKALGAHVTAVCHTRNLDLVRSLGADEVVDYTRAGFTSGGRTFDVLFDLVGDQPAATCRRVLHRDGVYVAASGRPGGPVLGPLPYLARAALTPRGRGPSSRAFSAKPDPADLAVLARMIEAGEVMPVIDRSFPLADAAAALTHQHAGRGAGKTVVTV